MKWCIDTFKNLNKFTKNTILARSTPKTIQVIYVYWLTIYISLTVVGQIVLEQSRPQEKVYDDDDDNDDDDGGRQTFCHYYDLALHFITGKPKMAYLQDIDCD